MRCRTLNVLPSALIACTSEQVVVSVESTVRVKGVRLIGCDSWFLVCKTGNIRATRYGRAVA